MANKGKKRKSELPVLHPDAAGIDIGASELFVAVPADRDPQPVRSFATFTEDRHALADWLEHCGIRSVAMESTSVYWIPVHQILEARGFEVYLVNARYVKNVPGRKTDVSDCQWIQYLHSIVLVRASFRPPRVICAIRSLWRHRGSVIQMAAEHVLHMQKALDQMNLQIHRVLTDITGVSGLKILDAILANERDPLTLARLCHGGVKSSENIIAKSLAGDYRPEHLFAMRQSLAGYRYYQRLLGEVDEEIQRQLAELKTAATTEPQPPKTTKRSHRIIIRGVMNQGVSIFGASCLEFTASISPMFPVSVPSRLTRSCVRLAPMFRNFAMLRRLPPGWDCVQKSK